MRHRLTAEHAARGTAVRQARREAGLAAARRWRRDQPAKAMLDAIYGEEPRAGFADFVRGA